MPFDDLRQWIAALDRAGELKRIHTEVDPILEIAEITDRVSKMHMWGQPPSAVRLAAGGLAALAASCALDCCGPAASADFVSQHWR